MREGGGLWGRGGGEKKKRGGERSRVLGTEGRDGALTRREKGSFRRRRSVERW